MSATAISTLTPISVRGKKPTKKEMGRSELKLRPGDRFNPYGLFNAITIPLEILPVVSAEVAIVFGVLMRASGQDGELFLKAETIAKTLHTSERSVRRCLDKLKQLKLIEQQRRGQKESQFFFLWHPLYSVRLDKSVHSEEPEPGGYPEATETEEFQRSKALSSAEGSSGALRLDRFGSPTGQILQSDRTNVASALKEERGFKEGFKEGEEKARAREGGADAQTPQKSYEDLERQDICPPCMGSGKLNDKPCWACNGSGKFYNYKPRKGKP